MNKINDEAINKDKLLVPVYLNQRIVFDLLAMLQNGIATVTAVTKTDEAASTNQESVRGTFGLSQALSSLLRIDVSAEKAGITDEGTRSTLSEERVHTPASLFYQLRKILIDKKLIKKVIGQTQVKSGDIVEFEANLSRNPMVETMDSMIEMMKMVIAFETTSSGGGKKNRNSAKNQYTTIKQQMETFSNSLKTGNTIDLTASKLPTGHEAVITVEMDYLGDPLMSDLVDGKFFIIGKVIRSILKDDGSISLIRKTALSKTPALLEQMFEPLTGMEGFDLPEPRWEIEGPAIHVLPIAIYA